MLLLLSQAWWLIGILATLAIAVCIACAAAQLLAPKFRRHKFRDRDSCTRQEWYERYCKDDSVQFHLVDEVLRVFGEAYELDPTLLRPDDRFSRELKMNPLILDDSVSALDGLLTKRFGPDVAKDQTWTSVRDVIHGVAKYEATPK
jgi:hypothetical protein